MNSAVRAAISQEFLPRVRFDEPMTAHTSWHVGGPAEAYFSPRDVDDLASFLRKLPESVPVLFVGLGSNLLVRDGGVRGVVVSTPGAFTRIERRAQTLVYCEASVPCARIARSCVGWGLAQGEFFSGIPGTLGGALAMNAGAFGDETWRHVISVSTIDRHGRKHSRPAQEFRVEYRRVEWQAGPDAQPEWFLSAELRFEHGNAAAQAMQDLLQRRRDTQPIGEWSCGSVFKNPTGDHAARLIEAAGLKGHRIGDAIVSEKHANFILNQGNASAADIERLITRVRQTVQNIYGIALETEVRIVGEALQSEVANGETA